MSKPRRLRLSIRFKILLVISGVLLAAFGSYLYLATSLFTNDKLAYIHDLNRALASSVAEQTASHLDLLSREVAIFAARKDDASFAQLMASEPDILRLQINDSTHTNTRLLEELGLAQDDLLLVHEVSKPNLAALSADGQRSLIYNSSIPPNVALITVAMLLPTGERALVDLRHQRLLRIFDRSELHETYLVDGAGRVLAHPRAPLVLQRSILASHTLTTQAVEGKFDQGAATFAEGETDFIGAFARVGDGAEELWVITQTPKAEALRASQELVRRSLLFGIAIVLAAFIVSIFFSRYLTAPILKLSDATRIIAKGRFDIDVESASSDEIGDLATAFNRMLKRSKKRRHSWCNPKKWLPSDNSVPASRTR